MSKDLHQNQPPSNEPFPESDVDAIRTAVDAIGKGDGERLRALLDAHPTIVRIGGALDPPDEELGYFSGATLLHYVAGNPTSNPLPHNVLEVVRILLDAGADPNATTEKGNTVVALVSSGRVPREAGVQIQLIDYLVERGADVNVGPWRTPLETALMHGESEAAEALFGYGARTDLRLAAGLGRIDLVEAYFLEDGTLGPDSYHLIPDVNGRKPILSDEEVLQEALSFAVVSWRFDTADHLLGKGVDINGIPGYFHSGTAPPLHSACSSISRDGTEMVEFLIDRGADPTLRDSGEANSPPFEWAIHNGRPKIVAYLLDNGCARDLDSHLCHAASRGNAEVLRILLDAGGNPDATNKNGETAIRVAEKHGYDDLVEMMRS